MEIAQQLGLKEVRMTDWSQHVVSVHLVCQHNFERRTLFLATLSFDLYFVLKLSRPRSGRQ